MATKWVAIGAAVGVGAVLVALLLLGRMQRKPGAGLLGVKGLLLGTDHRPSTSKFQWLAWILVTLFSYCWLAVVLAGTGNAVDISFGQNTLLAIGIATTTTVVAKAVAANKADKAVAANKAHKAKSGAKADARKKSPSGAGEEEKLTPEEEEARKKYSYLFLNNTDDADLAKFQLVAWTAVGIVVFLANVLKSASQIGTDAALPIQVTDIDDTLLLLMGIGHAGYVAKKIADKPKA
jgi:hypothetical protein